MHVLPSAPRFDDLVAHFSLLDEFDHSASMFSFCLSFVLCQSSQEASKKFPIAEIAKTMQVLHGIRTDLLTSGVLLLESLSSHITSSVAIPPVPCAMTIHSRQNFC